MKLKKIQGKKNISIKKLITPSKLRKFQLNGEKYKENKKQVLELRKQHYKENANKTERKRESYF